MSKEPALRPNVFFGNKKTGKTREIMEAVQALLAAQPESSYTVLEQVIRNEYRASGYEPKPVTVKVSHNSFEVITEADIVIVLAIASVDFALINHLKNLGKHVFVEIHAATYEESLHELQNQRKFYQYDSGETKSAFMPNLTELFATRLGGIPHVDVVSDPSNPSAPETLLNPEEDLNFYDCNQ